MRSNFGISVPFEQPNIIGKASRVIQFAPTYTSSGALYSTDQEYNNFSTGQGGFGFTFNLDAARSNPVYGGSNTVQPAGMKILFCIKS